MIDYQTEDFAASDNRYDVIFDVVGKIKLNNGMACLAPGGRYLLANPRMGQLLRGDRTYGADDRESSDGQALPRGKRLIVKTAERTTDELLEMKKLVEDGVVRGLFVEC